MIQLSISPLEIFQKCIDVLHKTFELFLNKQLHQLCGQKIELWNPWTIDKDMNPYKELLESLCCILLEEHCTSASSTCKWWGTHPHTPRAAPQFSDHCSTYSFLFEPPSAWTMMRGEEDWIQDLNITHIMHSLYVPIISYLILKTRYRKGHYFLRVLGDPLELTPYLAFVISWISKWVS